MIFPITRSAANPLPLASATTRRGPSSGSIESSSATVARLVRCRRICEPEWDLLELIA
ncbi:MAG TPA: hypothetical protein VEK39_02415 [Solirubrobacterales bacterium]|nr:hypothetical protein [Solirubrobacterales bacterium]